MEIGPEHLGFNMLVLWFVDTPLEERMGRRRFLLLYLMAGLAGSAGAILVSPCVFTVGASGAIFGLFGAGFVLERQGVHLFGSWLFVIVVINLALTLGPSGISVCRA